MKKNIQYLIVDLFCGAGGTTTGFERAEIDGAKVAKVIACVNHDPKAIKSHWLNHPEVKHFEEDIRTLDLTELKALTLQMQVLHPEAHLILWASLECTNFSKAKGGQPRDADSRTLADHLDRYITTLNPDYVQIENVVEFMSWGPLDERGKPLSKKSGSDWLRWRKHISTYGYTDEWKELNSADFGAYTSRNRLFGCFAKDGLPFVWPESTHAKKPQAAGMFGVQQKWKAVKEVLDFDDEGISIFNRKKPLVEPSLERVEAGLIKFVAGGKEAFLSAYNSGKPKSRNTSIQEPCRTVLTSNTYALVQSSFIAKQFSGKPAGKVIPVTGPAGTITTSDGQSLVQCKPFILSTNFKGNATNTEEPAPTLVASRRHPYVVNPSFIAKYYGTGGQLSSIEDPAGTITTKDRMAKVQPIWFDKTFTGNGNIQSIESPAGTIMPVDKHRIVNCLPFILNPSHGGHSMTTDAPCPVIIARQDKAPLYLIQFKINPDYSVPIYEDDSKAMVRIKEFMAMYGLADIKMRMLKVDELLPIQGFPKDYKLFGNQTDQKKFIGNSVVPHVVESWCKAMAYKRIINVKKTVA